MVNPRDLHIADFYYELPPHRIARHPLHRRSDSRLLVWKKGKISDHVFMKLPLLLPPDAALVLNSSRVVKARFYFTNTKGQRIEIFCLEPETDVSLALQSKGQVLWKCLVGGLKKFTDPELLLRSGPFVIRASIAEKRQEDVLIRFCWEPADMTFAEVLEHAGNLPIPPYLERETEEEDHQRYQTVYATDSGSVAAPTAGLHFTTEMLHELDQKEVPRCNLQLHVGSGTFRPVKAATMSGHSMHGEWITANKAALEMLRSFGGKKIIAVGTTSLRALESLYWLAAKLDARVAEVPDVLQWEPYDKSCELKRDEALQKLLEWMKNTGNNAITFRSSLLIAPPYNLRMAEGLITNFHQPASTLLLLVAAITGKCWKDIYSHALNNNYRFLSYGDSSLLLP